MKHKKTIVGLSLAAVLGVAIFLGLRAHQRIEPDAKPSNFQPVSNQHPNGIAQQTKSGQKQPASPWDVWVDGQADAVMRSFLKVLEANGEKLTSEEIAVWRDLHRAKLAAQAEEAKKKFSSPPPIEENPEIKYERTVVNESTKKHEGSQTVEALMATFDEDYNKVRTSPEAITIKADEMYPQTEWLEMLLDKGLRVDDYSDYSLYMDARANLAWLESEPERWASGKIKGVPPTDDWETFESAYIDRQVWEFKQIYEAKQEDPSVVSGLFTGPDDRTFLPYTDGRVYVERFETGAFFFGKELSDEQQLDVMLYGKHPEGYDIVYIDENGTILSEVPPPPRPTDEQRQQYKAWLEAQQNSPSERPTDVMDRWGDLNSSQKNDHGYTDNVQRSPQAAQEQFERAQAELLERATMTDAELEAALEKQYTSETAKGHRDNIAEEEIETDFGERFSPERLRQAQRILSQYGPEEGLDRLREVDPEMAEHTARKRNRGNPDREPTEDEPTR